MVGNNSTCFLVFFNVHIIESLFEVKSSNFELLTYLGNGPLSSYLYTQKVFFDKYSSIKKTLSIGPRQTYRETDIF